MNVAVSNAEKTIKVEEERAKRLEKELADAVNQLKRTAHDGAAEKVLVLDLGVQLKLALENGK